MMADSTDNRRTWVLFHADCLDGFGAAWAAWTALGDAAHYRPVRHGDPLPELPAGQMVYLLDFCYPPVLLCQLAAQAERVVVIDHHFSAQAALERYRQDSTLPDNLHARFDLEHSGCVLAWTHFRRDQPLPPLLAHIEDRDLWRHRLPGTREINVALYARLPLSFTEVGPLDLAELEREGTIMRRQQRAIIQRLLNSRHPVTLRGAKGLAVNAPHQFASELGEALALESGTFGLIYHYQGSRGLFECSLRSRDSFDVSALAAQLGGGGHRNAAGFTLKASPELWLGTLSKTIATVSDAAG